MPEELLRPATEVRAVPEPPEALLLTEEALVATELRAEPLRPKPLVTEAPPRAEKLLSLMPAA